MSTMTIEEAAERLRGLADELEVAAKDANDEGHADEAAAWLDWVGVVRDQLSLFVFITDTFVAGKVADRFVAKLQEVGGMSPAAKAEQLLRAVLKDGAFSVP